VIGCFDASTVPREHCGCFALALQIGNLESFRFGLSEINSE
jgi:hypothetical protein